ncbi:hypothetical protein N7497_011838 [Penicillium chrysogenum]|nr:hypothetical protein N7497_011838 [Penicillium chrysogenum]
MSDGVGESHRFPPIDGLHDRCCNISNERCRRAPLEFIKSPSPRSAKPASALSLSCHCILLFSNFSFAKTLYLNRFSISSTKPNMFFSFVIGGDIKDVLETRIATSHRPFHRLFPHSSPDSCFASNWHPTATGSTGSTGLDWFQLGSNGIKLGLPDSGFISCSFLVFRSLVFSPDLSLLSFLAFAHRSALFLLSSLTQFFRTFSRFSSRLVPCDCSQDTFVVSTRPPRLSTHPGSKEEISPAYWLVSQSPRTSFLQALLFQG